MALEIESAGTTLHLSGELDVATEVMLNDALAPLVASGGQITIELSGLSFIDSSGVRAIVRGARDLGHTGSILLKDPSPAVQRVLDLMRLDSIPNVNVARAQEA